jgi:sorbitol-specific phosphotransferase system component IIBC
VKINLGKIFQWLQGRTTAFCVMFFVSGNALQLLHKLDLTYVAFMTALLSAVIGHSIKEDLITPPVTPAADSPADTDKG